MNDRGDCVTQAKRRPAVMPPSSSRILSHPSFMPIYRESMRCSWGPSAYPVPVMTPMDFHYTDPSLAPGRRVPNIVTQFEGIQCLQLNTPAPIMSVCPSPPIRPDPFLTGPHPIRDLGSRTWTVHRFCGPFPSKPQPPRRRRLEVIQLFLEEDEAITSLMKLQHHHHAVPDPASSPHHAVLDPSSSPHHAVSDPASSPHHAVSDPASSPHHAVSDPASSPHHAVSDPASSPHHAVLDPASSPHHAVPEQGSSSSHYHAMQDPASSPSPYHIVLDPASSHYFTVLDQTSSHHLTVLDPGSRPETESHGDTSVLVGHNGMLQSQVHPQTSPAENGAYDHQHLIQGPSKEVEETPEGSLPVGHNGMLHSQTPLQCSPPESSPTEYGAYDYRHLIQDTISNEVEEMPEGSPSMGHNCLLHSQTPPPESSVAQYIAYDYHHHTQEDTTSSEVDESPEGSPSVVHFATLHSQTAPRSSPTGHLTSCDLHLVQATTTSAELEEPLGGSPLLGSTATDYTLHYLYPLVSGELPTTGLLAYHPECLPLSSSAMLGPQHQSRGPRSVAEMEAARVLLVLGNTESWASLLDVGPWSQSWGGGGGPPSGTSPVDPFLLSPEESDTSAQGEQHSPSVPVEPKLSALGGDQSQIEV